MRGKAFFFCHIRKTKNDKKLLLGQKLQLTIKEVFTNNRQYGFFFIRRLSLLLVFRTFNLTFHQDKKCLAFSIRKNITQFLHEEIARYKCNLLTKFYFLSLIVFLKYERIIKHAFLR